MRDQPAWESYEDVARFVLNQIRTEFGIDEFEGKQKIAGKRSGTTWEVECKGVSLGSETFFLVECRRYTSSRLNQESLGGFAYRIMDSGAAGGFIVSPLGLQEGAGKVANAENIVSIELTPDSRPELYVARYLGQLCAGMQDRLSLSDSVTLILYDEHGNVKERRQASS